MSNETINPIRHGAVSGATNTAAGAAGGAFKFGLGTAAVTAIAIIAGCSLLGGFLVPAVWGVLSGTTGISLGLVGAIGGAVAGVFGATAIAPTAGGLGAVFGAFKGGSRAASRVSEERGAANMLDAQVAAYQAQAYAAQQATTIYAPSAANNNNFPASTMNQAGSKIQADTAENLGTINGLQMQRA